MSGIKDWLQNMDDMSRESKRRDLDFWSSSDKNTNNKPVETVDPPTARRRRRRVNQNMSEAGIPAEGIRSVTYGAPENVYKAYFTIQKIIESADLCIQDIYQVPEEERATRVVVDQMRFDGILQGVLMHVALADGEFTLDQQLFIEGIVRRGHLLKLMKIQTGNQNELAMRDIAAMSDQEQRAFLNEMDKWIVRELSGKAIVLLAAFEYAGSLSDQGTPINYLNWISRCIDEIVEFVKQLKGKMSFEENYEAEDAVNRLLRNPWIEARNNYLG